jgi:hypothetical protein
MSFVVTILNPHFACLESRGEDPALLFGLVSDSGEMGWQQQQGGENEN